MAVRARREARPEWRAFRDDRMISFLQSFEADEDLNRGDTVDSNKRQQQQGNVDRAMLVQMFRSNKDFAKQTLLICLERKRGMLGSYVDLALEAQDTEEEEARRPLILEREEFWQASFAALMEKAVAMGDRRALKEALVNAHDRHPPLLPAPAQNSPALVAACNRESLDLVRLLVERGYRLESSHFKDAPDGSWSGLPFQRPSEGARRGEERRDDEILNLHILRAMAKPCYVFTCYSTVTEAQKKKRTRKGRSRCNFRGCDCRVEKRQEEEEGERDDEVDVLGGHPCPDSKNFEPRSSCVEHPACNDPILRLFEISKVASGQADKVPEYREELESVSASCNRHAVDLLDLCGDTGEVEVLLREKAGSTVFFHRSAVKRMRYPRLQMAILNNHKAFVGHTYCQQLLRNEWHGNVPWQGKSFWYRITYILAQAVMLIWWSFFYLLKVIFADFGLTADERRRPEYFPSSVYYYITGATNLDEPLNRFLSFTISYIFFLFLIIYCLFSPVIVADDLKNNFHWYHQCLLAMTLAMFLQVVISLHTSVRLARGINLFWKAYDILLCVMLGCAFAVRALMGRYHECPDEVCDQDTLEARIPYDTVSNCFFSVAGIMGITRLLYWFQLQDKVGPIVINLSRVVMDVITFLAVFGVLVLAYTMALVPIKAINTRCDNYTEEITIEEDAAAQQAVSSKELDPLEDGECWYEWKDTLFVTIFFDMLGLIFWGMLNPEYPEDAFSTESEEGFFAIAIYAVYCVFTIIILLNLLIAVMNATIQKVQDRKHLYWKFVRTSIWMEFFGEAYALPPPFSILLNVRSLLKAVYKRCVGLWRKVKTKVSHALSSSQAFC